MCAKFLLYSGLILGTLLLSCYIESSIAKKNGIIVFSIGLFFSLIGFKSSGIQHGSFASSCQSSTGNVESGSIFAIFQSLGMFNVFNIGMLCGVALYSCGYFDLHTFGGNFFILI